MKTIRTILASKTRWWHFFVLLITTVWATTFIYLFLVPFAFYIFYGESASSDRIARFNLVDFVFNWFALIATMGFLLFGYINNSRKDRFSNAKSYLIVAALLIILYLLRESILDVIYGTF